MFINSLIPTLGCIAQSEFYFLIQFFKSKRKVFLINWFLISEILYTQKKDLIESKKMFCLNDFFCFKEMICLNEIKFVSFKQNIFEQNKYLFE